MADYVQPGAVTRRVRFFDGQFLQDQDFIDEQKYHLDRERRIGKVLRITGVVDGLAVSSPEPNKVRVTAGTAIDSDGRHLVVAQDRTVDLPAATFNDKQGIRLLILFREQETDLATTGSKSEKRWLEDPQIVAVAADGQRTEKVWDETLPTVLLAQLRLDNKGIVTVDTSGSQQAGLRLPGSVGVGTNPGDYKVNVNGRTRLGGAEYGAAAVLSVAPGTVQFDGPGVYGGRFHLDGATGNIGIGMTHPGDVRLNVNGKVRVGGSTDYQATVVLSVAPGTVQFDAPGVYGGRLVIDGTNGRVGIGMPSPRTALDTGKGVLSGAANDYMKGQFTMSGGGTVTWGGPGGRLKWNKRFIAISAESGSTFANGYVDIPQPPGSIPAANVHDGQARSVDDNGVLLHHWESLFAVHPIGGPSHQLEGYYIRHYTRGFHAPSNWILVALVNGDDGTVKLGTGAIVAARSSSTKGSPIPTGVIMMWSGAANVIPDGWALCNGSGGTPDLRSRFVVGAGDGGNPQYNPGTSGEPDQHNHRIGGLSGNFGTTNAGGHVHGPPGHWYDTDVLGDVSALGKSWRSVIDRRGAPVQDSRSTNNGDHSHSVGVNFGAFDTHASAGHTRPKWYALCYIMKL